MNKIFSSIKNFGMKYSPEICIAAGIVGMVGAIIFTAKATIKAKEVIEETKEELDVKEVTTPEVIKRTWKYYIPAAVSFAVSTTLIILADHEHNKRNAALSVTCAGLETTLNAYKNKIFDAVGPKKAQQISDEVVKEKMEKNPISNNEVIMTGKGESLFYDAVSGRYFKSNMEFIRKIINDLNKDLLVYDFVSLNELYTELKLARIKLGDELGWNMKDGYIEVDFSAQIAENDEPCIVLDYTCAPRYDYRN